MDQGAVWRGEGRCGRGVFGLSGGGEEFLGEYSARPAVGGDRLLGALNSRRGSPEEGLCAQWTRLPVAVGVG